MKRIFVFVIFILAFTLASASKVDYEIPQVLIIQSYHSGFLWSDNIDSSIKSTLKGFDRNIRIKTEFLDTKRFNNDTFKENLKRMLEYKYKDSYFDVIITADNNAFEIVKELHDSVFKDIPVVFCGVNYFHPSQLGSMTNVTGVREKIVSLENFQLIKKIHKNVEKIIVLNEMTPTGKQNRINILADIREFKEDIDIEIVEDISIKELKELLSSLDKNTVVLYSIFFNDNQGDFLEYDESIMLVTEYSPVPVYVSIDFSLGYGAVGGFLSSGSLQGENAARLAIEILKGANAEKLGIIDVSPNSYYFDYEAMQKWGIKLNDIPENSMLLNYEESYFSRNKDLILRFSLIVLFLSLIIFWLITTVIKKNKLKNELLKSNESLENLKENLEVLVEERTEELVNKENKYRSVYENSGIAMITVAENDLVTMVNKKFEKLSGYSKEEVINKLKWQNFVDPSSIKKMVENRDLRYKKELPETDNYEIKLVNKKGFVLDALLNVVMVPETKEIISSITDISEKNAIQNKMKLLLEEQKAFNETKNNFYRNFIQDLNTPINSLNGMIDLIKYTEDASQVEKYLKIIRGLSSQMLYIINEMTDFQINNNNDTMAIQETRVSEFVSMILEMLIERSNIEKIYYKIDDYLKDYQYFPVDKLEKLIEIIIIKLAKNDPQIPVFLDITDDDSYIKFIFQNDNKQDKDKYIEVKSPIGKSVNNLQDISDFRFNYLIVNKLISLLNGKIEYDNSIDNQRRFVCWIKKLTAADVNDDVTEIETSNSIEKYILPKDVSDYTSRVMNKFYPLKVLIVNYCNISHFVVYKILEILNQKIDICRPEQDLLDLVDKGTYDLIIIDLSVISINNLDTIKNIRGKDNISQPYIAVNTSEKLDYALINSQLPDILNISNIALIIEAATEFKNNKM